MLRQSSTDEIGNGLLKSRTYTTSHTLFTLSVRKVTRFIYAYDAFCDKSDDEKESKREQGQ